jgi:Replication stress response SDE2 C-terminal/Pre-mRNA-splicing factor SF3A3, of SF3a complex, Prp9
MNHSFSDVVLCNTAQNRKMDQPLPPPPPQPIPPPPPPIVVPPDFREAVTSLSSHLETAWQVFCATQLLPDGTPLPKDVPGSIVDAWQSLTQQSSIAPGEPLPARSTGQRDMAVRNTCLKLSFDRLVATGNAVVQTERLGGQHGAALKLLQKESNPSVWLQAFYDRLREFQTYHAQQPISSSSTTTMAFQRMGHPVADGYDLAASIPPWIARVDDDMFTTDEVMGKYLDLQALHKDFVQSFLVDWGTTERTLYVEFLEDLSKQGLATWDEGRKLTKRRKYAGWLMDMERYLRSFLERTIPLINVDELIKEAFEEFNETWGKTGGWLGWEARPAEAPLAVEQNENKTATLNMADYATVDELMAKVDAETLKTELSLLGLKCGGTPKQRAERLFLLKDKKLDDLPAKVLQKKRKAEDVGERRIDFARREAVIATLLARLRPTLEATIRRTERRQTQTLKEREKEIDDEIKGRKAPSYRKDKAMIAMKKTGPSITPRTSRWITTENQSRTGYSNFMDSITTIHVKSVEANHTVVARPLNFTSTTTVTLRP